MSQNQQLDIICAGETLIDFIGNQKEKPIAEIKDYHRYLGGSPTNVAMNLARFGLNVGLIAAIGKDGFGTYIKARFEEAEINLKGLQEVDAHPTTVIFVSRTEGSPEFIPMRGADFQISEKHLPTENLKNTRLFHCSCFGLSRQPARSSILAAASQAHAAGATLSIDINYAPSIWPDRAEALEVVKNYCAMNPLIKASLDDVERIFGYPMAPDELFKTLHDWGAKMICLTLGKKGAMLSQPGEAPIELPAMKVEKIMDATGAGDAFWSGFLFAYLKEMAPRDCMSTGLKTAAIKLQNVGRIPDYASMLHTVLNL
ncbi:carbohydrate kinase family protein [Gilvibacter sp.]|uniref:carbohydrate kinase family protein n=1 Tax=Gilvibacter sp. TaxID=2729997 RepID=UPI003F4A36AF